MSRFKALVPAAGEGRRLRPHTHVTPKVLLEVAGKPILGHIMDRLLPAEPEEICVVVGAQSEQVESYLRENYRANFTFVHQDDPKGLGDAVFRARERFRNEPILILLGDTIVDLDISEVVGDTNMVAVKEVENPRRFGIVEVEGKAVKRVVEKPEHPASRLAIVGLYYFSNAEQLFGALGQLISSGHRTRGEFQLTDALQLMLESGVSMTVKHIEHWLDCGTPDALLATNRYLLSKNNYCRSREGVVIVPPVYVHDTARLHNAVVGPYVSIGANAEVRDSVVSDSIVNREAVVECALLEHSILGEQSVVKGTPRRLNLGGFSELEMG